MRKSADVWIVCAALIGLGACGAAPSDKNAERSASESAAQAIAVDGAPAVGRYRAVSEVSGLVLIEDLRADGTYTFSDEDGNVLEEGVYEQSTPELPCFTANMPGAVQKCYEDTLGEDGVWRTIDPDTGEVSVIERIGDE